MKLPSAEQAVVDPRTIRGYCLNENHPRGKHKARVFASALGVTRAHASWLRNRLLEAATSHPVEPGRTDGHGERYVLDFEMDTPTLSPLFTRISS